MRLIKILDIVNQIERSSFLKIIDGFSNEKRKANKEVDDILSQHGGQIKNIEDTDIVRLFHLTKDDFYSMISDKLQYNNFQLDILIDILIRDGNSIMSREWFAKLYHDEIEGLKVTIQSFIPRLDEDNKDIETSRKRDYVIYQNCIKTAFENDVQQNRERIVTRDEKTVLDTLAQNLGLSLQEQRIIYYSIVGIQKIDIDTIISSLKEIGVIFYRRKSFTIYVPDQIIWILRDLVGVELPNRYFRRILSSLKDGDINRIARKHYIDPKANRTEKINHILKEGVSISNVLLYDLYKDDISKSEKRAYLQDLFQNRLNVSLPKQGVTAEDRVELLIKYYRKLDEDENIAMSLSGFERMLNDMRAALPNLNKIVKQEFQLQEEDVLSLSTLSDHNIKPRDILDLVSNDKLIEFCDTCGIKKGRDIQAKILNHYKDVQNLLMENYALIGKRDLNGLKERGIAIKESDIGITYEELTKKIFKNLGYNVDEKLRKKLDTARAKMDIVLNLDGKEVIIIECKTAKGSTYTKYASVSRQLKSYCKLCEDRGYRVVRSIIVADSFSDDFVNDCEYDLEMNLSLITSTGLLQIMDAFQKSTLKAFPTKLFQKEGLLHEDRIVQLLEGKKATT